MSEQLLSPPTITIMVPTTVVDPLDCDQTRRNHRPNICMSCHPPNHTLSHQQQLTKSVNHNGAPIHVGDNSYKQPVHTTSPFNSQEMAACMLHHHHHHLGSQMPPPIISITPSTTTTPPASSMVATIISTTTAYTGTMCRSQHGSISTPCLVSSPSRYSSTLCLPLSSTHDNNGTHTKAHCGVGVGIGGGVGGVFRRAANFGFRRTSSLFYSTLTTRTRTATSTSTSLSTIRGIASYLAIEILSLIFRHLMHRKSILNCSLVSTHWYGPARHELCRIVRDMPYNGQGILHAIRARFAMESFPIQSMSMSIFDKWVSDLSYVYYRSNPDTTKVFAPSHPPDVLYHLIWTFLLIDQEFRCAAAIAVHRNNIYGGGSNIGNGGGNRSPKVSCRYFIRVIQSEQSGYPREYFDKRVLKNIYRDIQATPLLPPPHLIKALLDDNSVTGRTTNSVDQDEESEDEETTTQQGYGNVIGAILAPQSTISTITSTTTMPEVATAIAIAIATSTATATATTTTMTTSAATSSSASFPQMRWQQSMASDSLAKLRRIVKWWKHVVRQSKNEQHVLLSQQPPPLEGQLVLPIPDSLSDGSASLSETATSTTTFSPPRNLARPQIQRSSLSSANQPRGGSTSSLSLRSMLGRTGGSGGGRLNGNMHRIAASGGNSNSNSNRSSSSGNYNSSIIRSRSRSMSVIMNKGFSKIAEDGCWHVEGDGLDNVVRFPESTPKELAAA